MSQVSSVSTKTKRKEEQSSKDQPPTYPQWPGFPPVMMMPYPQPPQNQSDGSMRVL